MTENELIKTHIEECEERIGRILGYMETSEDANTKFCERNVEVLKSVVIALEEIQQYRAMEEKLNGISVKEVVNGFISAVEKETCERYERGRILTNEDADKYEAYKSIGTVEGYKRAIETSKENYLLYAEYKSKLQKFESIGTIEEFKDLKEKATPKKPIDRVACKDGIITVGDVGTCPNCGHIVAEDMFVCEDCLQVLDWEGGE